LSGVLISKIPALQKIVDFAVIRWEDYGGMAKSQQGKNANTINKLKREIAALQTRLQEREGGKGPLSRSSMEAYAGISIGAVLAVIPMNYWIRAILFVVLCFVASDFIWRSPLSWKWPIAIRVLLVAVVLVALSYVGGLNVEQAYRQAGVPPEAKYMVAYGALDENTKVWRNPVKIEGMAAGKIVVNGYILGKFSSRYKLVATCFHWNGLGDVKDAKEISKSGAFDIRDAEITIPIPWNKQFIEELNIYTHGTNYVLLMIPKKVSLDSFTSVREALDEGGYILGQGVTTGNNEI
jgi:hypothetical protein